MWRFECVDGVMVVSINGSALIVLFLIPAECMQRHYVSPHGVYTTHVCMVLAGGVNLLCVSCIRARQRVTHHMFFSMNFQQ